MSNISFLAASAIDKVLLVKGIVIGFLAGYIGVTAAWVVLCLLSLVLIALLTYAVVIPVMKLFAFVILHCQNALNSIKSHLHMNCVFKNKVSTRKRAGFSVGNTTTSIFPCFSRTTIDVNEQCEQKLYRCVGRDGIYYIKDVTLGPNGFSIVRYYKDPSQSEHSELELLQENSASQANKH